LEPQNIHRYLAKATLKPSVRIKIKIWNTYIVGKVEKFDNYLNLLISDASEIYLGRSGKREKKLGKIMIRGASIIFIGQEYESINLGENQISKLVKEEDEEIDDNEGEY
jgi:small nuclear ribonucleoprotein (snRNP)-like protein